MRMFAKMHDINTKNNVMNTHIYAYCTSTNNIRQCSTCATFEIISNLSIRFRIFQTILDDIGKPFWQREPNLWDAYNDVGLR